MNSPPHISLNCSNTCLFVFPTEVFYEVVASVKIILLIISLKLFLQIVFVLPQVPLMEVSVTNVSPTFSPGTTNVFFHTDGQDLAFVYFHRFGASVIILEYFMD